MERKQGNVYNIYICIKLYCVKSSQLSQEFCSLLFWKHEANAHIFKPGKQLGILLGVV